MKYWSSSRVGAVPQQPQSTKKKERSARYSQKKGITLEVRPHIRPHRRIVLAQLDAYLPPRRANQIRW